MSNTINYNGREITLEDRPINRNKSGAPGEVEYISFGTDKAGNRYEITWQTLEDWDGSDESEACDWEECEVELLDYVVDSNGNQVQNNRVSKSTEELKDLLKDRILSYSQDDFKLFVAESGWEDWMNDYTEAGDGEEISESESNEIESIQRKIWDQVWEDYNSMDEYSMFGAIDNADGSPEGINYSDYYVNWHDFRAESKEDAIKIAEELQSKHDQAMKDSPEFQALPVSKKEKALTNAPCYVQCLELNGERVEV